MAVTTITSEGIAAVVNARATGMAGVEITKCGVIQNGSEIKQIDVDGVELITPGLIRVAVRDQSTATYTAQGLKFYLGTGVLFATVTALDQAKSASSIFMALLEIDVSAAGSSPVTPSGVISMSPPVSTTSLRGIIETATIAESKAGADNARAVTPAGMRTHGDARYLQSVKSSSTSVKGLIETATNAESTAGTDGTRAVTPSGMRAHGDARYLQSVKSSSTSVKGLIETATNAEAKAGTDTTKAVTPSGMRGHGDARYSLNTHKHDDRYIRLIDAPRAVYIDVRSTASTSSPATALSWASAIHPMSGFNQNDSLIVKYKNRYSRGTGNGSSMWTDTYQGTFILVNTNWSLIAMEASSGWG